MASGPPTIPPRRKQAPLKSPGAYGYDLDQQPASYDYSYEAPQHPAVTQRTFPSPKTSAKSTSTQVDVEFAQESKAGSKLDPILRNILDKTPETTLAKSVKIKGNLTYERLLRVDGHFEGTLISKGYLIVGKLGSVHGDIKDIKIVGDFIVGKTGSVHGGIKDIKISGDLIIGKTGSVHGDIKDIKIVVCEGKIIGNLAVERVELRGKSVCHGNIVCKSLRMDPTVVLIGTVVCDDDDGTKNNVNANNEKENLVRGGSRTLPADQEREEQEEEGGTPADEES